ncbi:hypothetical protein ACHAWF_017817 [Thalassiosira exigua]
MAKSDWFDPRLTVFVIWGIFVILFICIPSKRIIARIFHFVGCKCCGYEEEIVPTNNRSHEVVYEILSNARKQEIDSLRASHITYRLHPFSLTLEEKHMLRRISENGEASEAEPSAPTEDDTSPQNDTIVKIKQAAPQDRKPDRQSSSQMEDIELGNVRGGDPPEHDVGGEENKEEEWEAEGDYTHISIPLPGHNFDGVDVSKDPSAVDKEKPKESGREERERKPGKLRFFGRRKDMDAEEKAEEVKTLEEGETSEPKGGERRSCSIFCAICLMEYEPDGRVSWSSNPECTHVFHEDCMVNWLVTLGRTKSKMQRFAEDPTEFQLLNYRLECPCCRQSFVAGTGADTPDDYGAEENV